MIKSNQTHPYRVTEGGDYAAQTRGYYETLLEAKNRARKLSLSSGTICCIWQGDTITARYANGQKQGPQA
ncbi:MAG: hypothetical protein EBR79_03825 [Proteobacteria bacterium]|nr:hypothetical protein [Pseudomonadota bacterium]NBX86764.1 hypothetical protein [Pseudomonadota bacterium]